jgi:hypothetical protein
MNGSLKRSILAKEIVKRIEADLNDRKGCGIDCLDSDIQKLIRNEWRTIVADVLKFYGVPQ